MHVTAALAEETEDRSDRTVGDSFASDSKTGIQFSG